MNKNLQNKRIAKIKVRSKELKLKKKERICSLGHISCMPSELSSIPPTLTATEIYCVPANIKFGFNVIDTSGKRRVVWELVPIIVDYVGGQF